MNKMDKIDDVLIRGVEKIYPTKEALEEVLRSGKRIRLYQGFDPSMPSLHLGNYVGLLKMRQFQDLGHEVIFLVGDFTGMIGDPSGKSESRKPLTREQVLNNSKNYKEQAGKILNFVGSNPAKIFYNSSWLDKISFAELLNLSSNLTYQQVKERDMFQKRIKEGKDIYLNEFLYPLMQGYDSVHMDVDLEIGGSDQLFNMMTGRDLMHKLKRKEKFVLTTKLLVDASGEKVGKTTGNALFLDRPAEEFYGGIMSFSDKVLALGFELLTRVPVEEIQSFPFRKRPLELKKRLAFEVVRIIYGESAARKAQEEFERVFQKRKAPASVEEVRISKLVSGEIKNKELDIVGLLMETKLVKSRSEAKRLIEQGAVEIDQSKVKSQKSKVKIKDGITIRVGKRKFARIRLN